jgi:putative oxidoreductase
MMAYLHGWPKLASFNDKLDSFPDPLGIGSAPSFVLVVIAEFFAAIAVALGLLTRAACIANIIAMSVAAFVFHRADPFAKKELAILYAVGFLVIALINAGPYSVDAILKKRRSKDG